MLLLSTWEGYGEEVGNGSPRPAANRIFLLKKSAQRTLECPQCSRGSTIVDPRGPGGHRMEKELFSFGGASLLRGRILQGGLFTTGT